MHRKAEWLETLLHLYGSRALPSDLHEARSISILADQARIQGQAPDLGDLAIAATAQQNGCTVLTRTIRQFGPLGGAALDPFEALPDAAL